MAVRFTLPTSYSQFSSMVILSWSESRSMTGRSSRESAPRCCGAVRFEGMPEREELSGERVAPSRGADDPCAGGWPEGTAFGCVAPSREEGSFMGRAGSAAPEDAALDDAGRSAGAEDS